MKKLLLEATDQEISASEVWYKEEDKLKENMIQGNFEQIPQSYYHLRDAICLRFSSFMSEIMLRTSISSIVGGIVHFACKEGNVPPAYLSMIIQHQYNISLPYQGSADPDMQDQLMLDLLQYACDMIQQFRKPDYSYNVSKAVRYIQNHLSEKMSLEIIAEHLKVSPPYLSALFHSEVGITLSDYVLRQKIDLAKEYLKGENLSITQISQLCGFEDSNYFSRVFKKHTMMSPRQYRKMKITKDEH